MAKKVIRPVDSHVGALVRQRRIEVGIKGRKIPSAPYLQRLAAHQQDPRRRRIPAISERRPHAVRRHFAAPRTGIDDDRSSIRRTIRAAI